MFKSFSLCLLAVVSVLAQDMGKDEESGKKAKLNEVVPDLTIEATDGKEFKLSDYRKTDNNDGKYVIVYFWAIGCPSGKANMPKWLELVDAMKERKDVVLIAVDTYGESEDKIKKFLKDNDAKYSVAADEGEIAKTFDASVVTQTFIIDREGKLVYKGAFGQKKKGEFKNYVTGTLAALEKGKKIDTQETKAAG